MKTRKRFRYAPSVERARARAAALAELDNVGLRKRLIQPVCFYDLSLVQVQDLALHVLHSCRDEAGGYFVTYLFELDEALKRLGPKVVFRLSTNKGSIQLRAGFQR